MSIPRWKLENEELEGEDMLYWLERYAMECAREDQLNTYR